MLCIFFLGGTNLALEPPFLLVLRMAPEGGDTCECDVNEDRWQDKVLQVRAPL